MNDKQVTRASDTQIVLSDDMMAYWSYDVESASRSPETLFAQLLSCDLDAEALGELRDMMFARGCTTFKVSSDDDKVVEYTNVKHETLRLWADRHAPAKIRPALFQSVVADREYT